MKTILLILATALTSFGQIAISSPGFVAAISGDVVAEGGGGGGPDTYYFAKGLGTNDFASRITSGYQPNNYAYGSQVIVTNGGTCTEISIDVEGEDETPTIKLALYDTSGNLLASGSGTVAVANTKERLAVSVNVAVSSSTTYWIFASSSTTKGLYYYNSANGDSFYANVAYASFPPDPITEETEADEVFSVGIYVD